MTERQVPENKGGITHNVHNLHENEIEKVTKLKEKIGEIKRFEGTLIGEYGARLTAIMRNGRKQSFELSCGQLGAFDRDVHNDPKESFNSYKMNWTHMLNASLDMPERWYVHQ
jgi:hypothetical protein